MADYGFTGVVRGRQEVEVDFPSGADVKAVVNPRGDLSVAQALPFKTDIVRMRNSYQAFAATAVAPVVALPTTTAQVTIWNGESAAGKCYVVDSVLLFCTVSAGAATTLGLVACMNVGIKAAQATGLTIRGLAGQAYRGSGTVAVGQTITNDTWHPLGPALLGAASQVALTLEIPVYGQYVLPPGAMFSIAAIANTVTTITCRTGLRWHEVQLPTGP